MSKGFKPCVDRKYVGTYRPRIDGWDKASGRAEYVDDITLKCRLPNMLYAKVLRSPYPHARIKDIDTNKAEKLLGVKAILTYKDAEIASLKPINTAWSGGFFTTNYDHMVFKHLRDVHVLGDQACWVGDGVGAVVAAESERIAEEALRLIDVEWEELPFVLDPLEAMQPGAPVIHPEIAPNNVLPADPQSPFDAADVFIEKGNLEKGFAEAEATIEVKATYHNPTQCALDNWCCLAVWEGDQLSLWTNGYEADQTRMLLSEMLDMPLNKIRVIVPYLGGQFGARDNESQPFYILTTLLAKRTRQPVKFKHTRKESFYSARTSAEYTCKMGAKKDGTITASHFKSIGNAGAYAGWTPATLKMIPKEVYMNCLAHIPNLKMESYAAYTNIIPTNCVRGVGNIQINLILGLAVDTLAEKLHMDPIELAIKNFGHEWENLPDKSLEAILRKGARRIGWDKRHKPGEGLYHGSKKRGIGFSFNPSWHAEWGEELRSEIQVRIKLNPDATVALEAPTIEAGPGSNTCNVLGCAEALSFLDIRPEDIKWISKVDTDSSMREAVQTDSCVSFLQSEVMIEAADKIKAEVLKRAAEHFKISPEDVVIDDGIIWLKVQPIKQISVKELLQFDDCLPITAVASRKPNTKKTGVGYQAAFADVEVDTDTGRTDVLRLVILNDLGTVMYASGAEAQQRGGQGQGIGESLMEEIIYDEKTGIPLDFNWVDYKIPTIADIPDVEPVLMEVWKGAGEYGACGIGESVLVSTPRAIANAIYNAIGSRIDDPPFTPDKILKALGKI